MESVSLIISSYNQPNALALVLEGVLTQSQKIDEVVIGDDGSQDDTRALVEAFSARATCPVHYEWQEDRGFRKSRSLNKAIRRSRGEILLFLDGDCIPPPEWARRYVQILSTRVVFATAGCVLMDLERTRALPIEQIAAKRIDEYITDAERDRLRKIHKKELFYALLRQRKKPKILGGNWAARRASIYDVNGYDEKFDGFGKEDSDIRNRLRNAGHRGRSLWDCNWVYHCSHELDPRRNLPEVVRGEPDYDYYRSRLRAKRCDFGLSVTGEKVAPFLDK